MSFVLINISLMKCIVYFIANIVNSRLKSRSRRKRYAVLIMYIRYKYHNKLTINNIQIAKATLLTNLLAQNAILL